jgi:hypothetical protein
MRTHNQFKRFYPLHVISIPIVIIVICSALASRLEAISEEQPGALSTAGADKPDRDKPLAKTSERRTGEDSQYFHVTEYWGRGYDFLEGLPVDFNRDGRLDFVGTQVNPKGDWSSAPMFAFRNNGDYTFTDVSAQVFPDGTRTVGVGSQAVAIADFNGDGLPDLFLGESGMDQYPFPGEQSRLLFLQKDGTYKDVTDTNLPQEVNFAHSVTHGDFDGDGDIDIFKGNLGHGEDWGVGPHFLVNDGTGKFAIDDTRLPDRIGEFNYWGPFCWRLFDMDRDGDLDLYMGIGTNFKTRLDNRDMDRDLLLINDGSGNYSRAPDEATPKRYEGGVTWWFTNHVISADFNGDGWPDIMTLVSNAHGENPGPVEGVYRLMINNRDGTFSDATDHVPSVSCSGLLRAADFNGDGWMDYVIDSEEEVALHLFINKGNGSAEFFFAKGIVDGWYWWSKPQPADVDGDGDTDILCFMGPNFHYAENIKPYKPAAKPLKRPARVKLLSPADGASLAGQPVFSWKHINRALNYTIQVGRDPQFLKFTKYDLDKFEITGNSLDIAKLTSRPGFKKLKTGVTYYWRVAGANYSGQGKWSKTYSFSIAK